ncbi:MAG: toll/interleukin-1 receptor domain-containing protein [Pseudonocardiaceae bacterium]
MARVFVSHASEDLALACDVHRWLIEAGHEAFLDQDLRDGIVVGEQWRHRLQERLRWADAVVCVMGLAFSGQLSWWLFQAACCRFRYSSWTSRGVL